MSGIEVRLQKVLIFFEERAPGGFYVQLARTQSVAFERSPAYRVLQTESPDGPVHPVYLDRPTSPTRPQA